jgi:thiamine biosynthesis lipoprotein
MEPDFAESESWGMGTVITHRVFGSRREEAVRAAVEETGRLERRLSRFLPDSDIGRLNAAAGRSAVVVGEETFEILLAARRFSECSRGAFDVTVCPLVALWDVLHRRSAPPDKKEIQKLLGLVGSASLVLDAAGRTACLSKPGQAVDLGGIGKGYAADKVTCIFKAFGIESAFTNFGGNVAALGYKPDGTPWRVGITHPRQSGALIGAVAVAGRSVVTSGDYQRFFIASDGRRYHHLLDPRTGYPAGNGFVSATVVAESSMTADALSTALFVLGPEEGLKVLASYPGAEAVTVDADMTVRVTRGLRDAFTPNHGVRVDLI